MATKKKPSTIEQFIEEGRQLAREALPSIRALPKAGRATVEIKYRHGNERLSFALLRGRDGSVRRIKVGSPLVPGQDLATDAVECALLIGLSEVITREVGEFTDGENFGQVAS